MSKFLSLMIFLSLVVSRILKLHPFISSAFLNEKAQLFQNLCQSFPFKIKEPLYTSGLTYQIPIKCHSSGDKCWRQKCLEQEYKFSFTTYIHYTSVYKTWNMLFIIALDYSEWSITFIWRRFNLIENKHSRN